ncbi:hypothetical protein GCM10027614_59500 [Micromonospora vulcania]
MTVKLALIALAVAIIFGVSAGVIAGIRRASIFDNSTLVLTLLVLGIPTIVLAPLAQYFLGVKWQLFPPTAGAEPTFYALLLPGIVLGSLSLATALRLTRASVAENLRADYVRTARSKGLVKRRIVTVHVLRNSLIPVVTFLGVELGNLMSGAIITEGVFNIPGVGFNLFRGIRTEDGPWWWASSACSSWSTWSRTWWWTSCTPYSIRGSAMSERSEQIISAACSSAHDCAERSEVQS